MKIPNVGLPGNYQDKFTYGMIIPANICLYRNGNCKVIQRPDKIGWKKSSIRETNSDSSTNTAKNPASMAKFAEKKKKKKIALQFFHLL